MDANERSSLVARRQPAPVGTSRALILRPGVTTAACFAFALAAALWQSADSSAGLPASQPTTAQVSRADDATRDALRSIEDVPARPSGIPAHDPPASPPVPAWGGWDLVRFFAPVLVLAGSVGVSASILGTFVLLRREALLALAVPQVVAAGAAVGMRWGWPTLPPAVVAAAAALAYLVAARRGGERGGGRGRSAAAAGSAVPALYVSGLSVSFLVIAGSGAHIAELQNLFTGVDVAVTPGRAAVVAPVVLAAGGLCAALWRRWLLLAQAPAAAELAGMSPARSDALFLTLLTVVLLLGTGTQGVVMVLAMLFLPAAVVQPWVARVPTALAAAAVAALACLAVAFAASNAFAWPLSQTVGGVGGGAFLLSRAAARACGR